VVPIWTLERISMILGVFRCSHLAPSHMWARRVRACYRGTYRTFRGTYRTFRGTYRTFRGTYRTFRGTYRTFRGAAASNPQATHRGRPAWPQAIHRIHRLPTGGARRAD